MMRSMGIFRAGVCVLARADGVCGDARASGGNRAHRHRHFLGAFFRGAAGATAMKA
jgi:hypothetical protein